MRVCPGEGGGAKVQPAWLSAWQAACVPVRRWNGLFEGSASHDSACPSPVKQLPTPSVSQVPWGRVLWHLLGPRALQSGEEVSAGNGTSGLQKLWLGARSRSVDI